MKIETYDMAGRLGTITPDKAPTCKLFFPCLETGGEVMTDVVNGVVWSPNDEPDGRGRMEFDQDIKAVYPAMYVNGPDQPKPAKIRSGALPRLSGQKAFLYLAVGRISCFEIPGQYQATFARVALGDNNGIVSSTITGLGLSGASVVHFLATDVNVDQQARKITVDLGFGTSANWTVADEDVVWYGYYDYNAGARISQSRIYRVSDYALLFDTDTLQKETLNADVALDLVPYIRIHGIKLYGLALHQFDNGLPADIDRAIKWMARAWKRGDRSIYPGAVHWR
ncbi:MAG TPA: hypothetical protein ENK05_11810 [Gammaproteobacteria bacterium]|nr:hypothetical protein [Gammaproteobacteria bacterium]